MPRFEGDMKICSIQIIHVAIGRRLVNNWRGFDTYSSYLVHKCKMVREKYLYIYQGSSSQPPKVKFIVTTPTASFLNLSFLYTSLQTGCIMVWWCLSVPLSGSPYGFPGLYSSVSHSFRAFLLHAFMYWAEIWRLTLVYCTISQV